MPGWAVAPPTQPSGATSLDTAVFSGNGGEEGNRMMGAVLKASPLAATLPSSSQPVASSSTVTPTITRTASHPIPSSAVSTSKDITHPRRASPSTGDTGSTTPQNNSTPPPPSNAPDFTPFSPSQTQNLIASLRKGTPLTASSIAIARNGSPTAATAPTASVPTATSAPPSSGSSLQAVTSSEITPAAPIQDIDSPAYDQMDIDVSDVIPAVTASVEKAAKDGDIVGQASTGQDQVVHQAEAVRQLSASPDVEVIENPNSGQPSTNTPPLPAHANSAMPAAGASAGSRTYVVPSTQKPAQTQPAYGMNGASNVSQSNNAHSQAAIHAAAEQLRQQQKALQAARATPTQPTVHGPDPATCACAGCTGARKPPSPTGNVQQAVQHLPVHQAVQNAAGPSAVPQRPSPHAPQANLPNAQVVQQATRQVVHNANPAPSTAPGQSAQVQQSHLPNGISNGPLPSPTGSNQVKGFASFAGELQDIENTLSRNMQSTWNALFQPMEMVRKRIEQMGNMQTTRIADLERQLAQATQGQNNSQSIASLRQQIYQKDKQILDLDTRLRNSTTASERHRGAVISAAHTHHAATENLKAQHASAIRSAIAQTEERVRKEQAALPKSDDVKAVEERYKGMLAKRVQKMAELQVEKERTVRDKDKVISEKDKVIAHLQAKVTSGSNGKSGSQAKVVILEEQLRKTEEEKMNLEDDLAQAQSKLQIYSTMPSTSSVSTASTSKLQADLADSQVQGNQVRAQLDEARRAHEALASKRKADIERLTAEVQTGRDSATALQTQLEQAQKELEERKVQLAKVGTDIAATANHVTFVRKNMGMEELPQGTKLAPKITATLQTLSDRIKEKTLESAARQAELATMTKTVTSLETRLTETTRLLAEMEASKHKVEKELETVRANATAQVQLAETRITNTDKEVEELKEEIMKVDADYTAEVKGLKEELEAVRKSLKDKEVEVLENVERVKVLADQLEVAEVAKETSPSAVEEWEKVKAEMTSEIEELKRKIAKLEKAKIKTADGTKTSTEPISTPQSSSMRLTESGSSGTKTKTGPSTSPTKSAQSAPSIAVIEATQVPASAVSSPSSRSAVPAASSPLSSLSSRTVQPAPLLSARSATPSTSDSSKPRGNIVVTPSIPKPKVKEADKPAISTPAKAAPTATSTPSSARKGVAKIIKSAGPGGSPSRRTPEVVITTKRASPAASTSSSASRGGNRYEAIDLTAEEAIEPVAGPSMNRKMKRKKPIKEPLFLSDEDDEEEEPMEEKEPETKKRKREDEEKGKSLPAPRERDVAVNQPVRQPPQTSSVNKPTSSTTPVTPKSVAPPTIKREWVETQLKALTCKSRDGQSTVCKMCITEIKDHEERKKIHETDRTPISNQTHKGIMDHLMTHTVTLRRYRKKRQREGKEPATP